MATSSPTTTIDADASTAARQVTMTVLIADKFEQTGVEQLEALGCRVQLDPDLNAESLPSAIAEHDPEVLIVRSTKVLPAAIEAAHRLSVIVRAGAGYDTIDVAAASSRGIFVANCPGMNAVAVAELAWALILACDRRVPDQCADIRAGAWKKGEYAKKAAGLYGRTLGIVGLGRIGREVAQRGKAFGMKVVAWSNSLTEDHAHELGLGYCSNLINLAKLADVVSVHVAATPATKGLIGDKFCAALKPGAYVVNTSRGSVVDEAALTAAIREKGVRAGLDVYADEPGSSAGEFHGAIIQEPGVYGTHHVGASTDQAQQAIAAEVVRIIESYARTGAVPNCVNRAVATSATNLLTVRHLNRPGVLAHVFYTLGQAGINVEEMENIIYDGALAACARIQLAKTPKPEHLSAIRANDDVLSVELAQLGDDS
jgi:D-3-phosphoglycerate dehydrogenase